MTDSAIWVTASTTAAWRKEVRAVAIVRRRGGTVKAGGAVHGHFFPFWWANVWNNSVNHDVQDENEARGRRRGLSRQRKKPLRASRNLSTTHCRDKKDKRRRLKN